MNVHLNQNLPIFIFRQETPIDNNKSILRFSGHFKSIYI